MKKLILIPALVSLMILNFSFTTLANPFTAKKVVSTTLSNYRNFTKLKISGNVNVFLVQSNDESVIVNDLYYSKNAVVQQYKDELKITSFDKKPLKVYVYTKNLNSIEVNENASIQSLDTLNFIALDLILNDNAKASLSLNTVSLFSKVEQKANLTLSGTALEHTSFRSSTAQLNTNKFLADVTFSDFSNQNKSFCAVKSYKTLENIELDNF